LFIVLCIGWFPDTLTEYLEEMLAKVVKFLKTLAVVLAKVSGNAAKVN
jgi:hypothetical protein